MGQLPMDIHKQNAIFIPIASYFTPFIIFRDRHNWGRYILKHRVNPIIIEFSEVGAEPIPEIIFFEYNRGRNREDYNKIYSEVVCKDMADRLRYEEIEPTAIGEPLMSKIAEILQNYNNYERNN